MAKNVFKPQHEHQDCIGEALSRADAICRLRGVKLTQIRRRVLELIWDSHKAVKAYQLLDRLSEGDKRVRPPTIYRALDFLMTHGLVHKVDSLNAYIGCSGAGKEHNAQFYICEACGEVSEIAGQELSMVLDKQARKTGFVIQRQMVELHGRCQQCTN